MEVVMGGLLQCTEGRQADAPAGVSDLDLSTIEASGARHYPGVRFTGPAPEPTRISVAGYGVRGGEAKLEPGEVPNRDHAKKPLNIDRGDPEMLHLLDEAKKQGITIEYFAQGGDLGFCVLRKSDIREFIQLAAPEEAKEALKEVLRTKLLR
jgi:hypothetical protein